MRSTLLILATLGIPVAAAAIQGCGGSGGGGGGSAGGPVPAISNLNGSTNPASPTGVAIEINGSAFGANPGQVSFAQGTAVPITVAPIASAWSDTSIVVTVPGGLAAPGSASVTVTSAGGAVSNAVSLNLTVTPSFNPSSIAWAATTPLPAARRAHAAVAVPIDASSAWIYVLGGNDGSATANISSVVFASLDSNGTVGAWSVANALPSGTAFLAVAEADSTNSPVPNGQAFIYAIGGQATPGGTPGGTSTVFVGSVNLANGAVTWSATASLPETRVGARAAVANGFLHVTGGLSPTGAAIGATASAPIQSNGTLGAFSEPASGILPSPVAFHESFAFGGFLYAIGGDLGPQTTPYLSVSSMATTNTWFAPIRSGAVGSWQASSKTVKAREKGALLVAFGQLMLYEGSYGNTNFEGERSSVNADGSLGSFGGQTGGSIPGLNTFNTAGVTSPILTSSNSPRFLLLGGDSVAAPGTPSAVVEKTTAP